MNVCVCSCVCVCVQLDGNVLCVREHFSLTFTRYCYSLSQQATIAVQVDDDLDIVENSLSGNNVLRIEQSSSQPFTLKLRPRAIGQLAITVAAVNNLGERDIVTKRLFVKVLCCDIQYEISH